MLFLTDWTQQQEKNVNPYVLRLLTVNDDKVAAGTHKSAAVLPQHYVSEQRLSQAFRTLGKTAIADLLREKLPRTKRIRSGDLGEILATEYIGEQTGYVAPIKRLRWKDQREMPMRGEDVIGIRDAGDGTPLRFLKTEAKSRATLDRRTITEARQGLDRDNGLPSGHTLSFVAERLLELGEDALSDAITEAQLDAGIGQNQVEHLLFTFTGNAPHRYLEASLTTYTGTIPQIAVGLHVATHQEFIDNVFDEVLNAHEPGTTRDRSC